MYLKSYFFQLAKSILIRFPKKVIRFFEFTGEYQYFKTKNDGRFTVRARDWYPCLADKVTNTPFDQHYTYHPAWAARVLATTKPEYHVDISSILSFGTIVSAFIPIKFYDYRPAKLSLSNYDSGTADLVKLDFPSNSIASISCMHTIEHIGLGRYGDPLDVKGDVKAISELIRVTRKGGDILFVTPVGKPRIEFNAHRVYGFEQIMEYFQGCALNEFALVPDAGGLIKDADPGLVKEQQYGCGCFWFKKL